MKIDIRVELLGTCHKLASNTYICIDDMKRRQFCCCSPTLYIGLNSWYSMSVWANGEKKKKKKLILLRGRVYKCVRVCVWEENYIMYEGNGSRKRNNLSANQIYSTTIVNKILYYRASFIQWEISIAHHHPVLVQPAGRHQINRLLFFFSFQKFNVIIFFILPDVCACALFLCNFR